MKRFPTIILRCAVIIAGIAVLGICYGLSWFAFVKVNPDSEDYHMVYVLLTGVGSAAVPVFIALFQTYKLLGYIDANRAFSDLSLKSLKIIMFCAIGVFAVCTVIGLPFFYYWAEADDAPGLVIVGMAIAGIAFVIAVFTSVLSRLFKDALAIKSENDLTV